MRRRPTESALNDSEAGDARNIVHTEEGELMQNGDSRKRSYTTPQLTMHGTLEQLTKQLGDKKQGSTDGLVFAGITLVNVS
jgi:hypothetical protein